MSSIDVHDSSYLLLHTRPFQPLSSVFLLPDLLSVFPSSFDQMNDIERMNSAHIECALPWSLLDGEREREVIVFDAI